MDPLSIVYAGAYVLDTVVSVALQVFYAVAPFLPI